MNEDTITWLYLPRNQDFVVVLQHVERIRIRSSELTKNLASTVTQQLLAVLQRQWLVSDYRSSRGSGPVIWGRGER